MKRFILVLSLLAGILSPAGAAGYQRSLVLSLPWGSAPGQVGRHVSQGPDDAASGPGDFDVDTAGRFYLIDDFNSRIEVPRVQGEIKSLLPVQKAPLPRAESIAAGKDAFFFIELIGTAHPKARLPGYDLDGRKQSDLDLTALGIGLPLELELDPRGGYFIQDNATFITWHLDSKGSRLEKMPNDDRLMWLSSRGLFRFEEKKAVKVFTRDGKLVGTYWGEKGSLQVLGVDSAGALYLLYQAEDNQWGIDKISVKGEKLYSLRISE